MKIGILGAGITGLGLGYFLANTPHDFTIFEKRPEVGGELMNTEIIDGFTFNTGGEHLIWSDKKELVKVLLEALGDNYFERHRNTKIYHKGALVTYPFEHGLKDLPPKVSFRCMLSFIKNYYNQKFYKVEEPKNVYEWCYATFGSGISREHLVPVNRNWWKLNPKQLSLSLVKRIPQPTVEEIIKSWLGEETVGLKPQATFYYPKVGGCLAIAKSLANLIPKDKIRLDEEVMFIEKADKWIVHTNKNIYEFDKIISTLPLRVLARIVDGVDKDIKRDVKKLKVNSLAVVLIALKKELNNNYSWINFGTNDVLMNRISFPKNYSEFNAPKGKDFITAEVTYRRRKKDNLEERVVKNLVDTGFIKKDDVAFTKIAYNKYAYPVPDIYSEQNIDRIRKHFTDKGIILTGRFGNMDYINMDKCIEKAKETVEKLGV